MNSLVTASAPHIHSGNATRRIMLDVILALLPAAIASVVLFGVPALMIIVTCVASAVLSEFLFNAAAKRPQSVGDLSAVVTGLLLALNLSTNVSLWQCAVGSAFAIVLVKCVFGGLGKNFANPAITARVFMLLAFQSVAGGAMPRFIDAVSSATPLEVLAGGAYTGAPTLMQMFLGVRGGAIGEGCIAALVAGYIYLVCRKVIKWYIPVCFIGTVFICFLIAQGDAVFALYEIMAGGLFIGAIFMATDYVTTPVSCSGRVIFAVCCGLITFVIRRFFAYPEGVSFSILVMNILTPFVEKLTANKPLGGA